MFKKLLVALLCMQLLLAGCSPRTGEEPVEEKEPETTVEEEAPVPEEKPPEQPAAPQTPPAQPDPVPQQPSAPQPQPAPTEEAPVVQEKEPEPPANTAEQFDVALLDSFKSSSTLSIDGSGYSIRFDVDGTSFDPFIDDLKDILEGQQIIPALSEKQKEAYSKKDTSPDGFKVRLISEWFNYELYIFDGFGEYKSSGKSIFFTCNSEILEEVKSLMERTPGDRGPDHNKNLDPKKPDPAMG